MKNIPIIIITTALISGCASQKSLIIREPAADKSENISESISVLESVSIPESVPVPESVSVTDSVSASENVPLKSVDIDEKTLTKGTETYRGFLIDNVYHSDNDGDVHFNLYIPESFGSSKSRALFLRACLVSRRVQITQQIFRQTTAIFRSNTVCISRKIA